ncbi:MULTISPECIES: BtrH N-terminal domain-containing protein [Pseudonocardia]|nr:MULTISPECIES: BtrH N-terminal domain-containing protein [Pseudonocardia]BBG01710.1 lantibiotic ABC transporter [Pseudonocardia autotrophica]
MTTAVTAGPGAVVLDGMPATGGVHCETSTLGALLEHAGVRLSEPMLFGLGEGLSFVYWDSKRQAVPFLGGRVKPFELTQNLAGRLGLELRVQETTSARKAWSQVQDLLDAGAPVGLQLDSHDLDYFTSRVHFAGHVVALYGYDPDTVYLLDTEQQGGRVSTSRESLARARAARGPMSAPHRSFTLGAPGAPVDVAAAIRPAIVGCAEEFLSPPIANVGCRGVSTTAKRIVSWLDRVDDPTHDLPLIAMLMERGGTGGGLFRFLYRDFLTECLPMLDDGTSAGGAGRATDLVTEGRDLFDESAQLWTRVAGLVESAGRTEDADPLSEAAELVHRIARIETAAMTALRSV